MKLKGRKATVFFINLIVFIFLYVLTILIQPAAAAGIAPSIVWAIVGNGAAYITGQVADAWQASKYFKKELAGGSGPDPSIDAG